MAHQQGGAALWLSHLRGREALELAVERRSSSGLQRCRTRIFSPEARPYNPPVQRLCWRSGALCRIGTVYLRATVILFIRRCADDLAR